LVERDAVTRMQKWNHVHDPEIQLHNARHPWHNHLCKIVSIG